MIAISGFNIALLIALADRLTLPFLPRRTAAFFVMAFITLYTAVLVGGSASVLRAALMGGVYLLSMHAFWDGRHWRWRRWW
ncbi:MAG: ComEC/Rec2 family competence protein [Chloroflexota bacterium]